MKLRRLPEDFGVVEHLTPGTLARIRTTASATDGGAGAAGERRELHAIYRLTKRQLTTPEASVMLARAMTLKASAVEHAGLKDKHAVTTQHVSVHWEDAGAAAPDAPRELRSERDGAWGATLVGWLDRPLAAADIERNQFTLVVRSLDRRDCDLLAARANSLDDDGECWLANYFGDQRFGSARHGEGFAAAAMCHGDFLLAFRLLAGSPARKDTGRKRETTRLIASAWGPPDATPGPAASPHGGPPEPPAGAVWASIARKLPPSPERRAVERLARDNNALAALGELSQSDLTMSVEAFQSYLWNQTLRSLVASAAPSHARVDVQTDYGPCAFPIATADDRRWTTAARELRTISLPVPAATTALSPPWAPHLLDALKPFNLRPDQLRIEQLRRPRFNEAARPAFVRVEDLAFGPPANDELAPKRSTKPLKRTVSFSLPRGAYATVLMRALGCE